MLYKKQGFPEEGELVFCKVTSVQYNSVFVNVEEYSKSGLIHISEISPGRIRNIRDFVKEGKMIVCKVLRVDEKKGHIDLSLRRVTEMQKKQKTSERKQEQKAEKILEMLALSIKKDAKKVYEDIAKHVFKKYEFLHQAFEEVVESDLDLAKLGIDKNVAKELEEIIRDKIKPKFVNIKGVLSITTFQEDGVELVKKSLLEGLKVNKKNEIKYLGAGRQSLVVEAKDYKEAEKILKDTLDIIKKGLPQGKVEFKRKEKKD